jgi:ABC-type antimicrobial peptide transport system permease subunit
VKTTAPGIHLVRCLRIRITVILVTPSLGRLVHSRLTLSTSPTTGSASVLFLTSNSISSYTSPKSGCALGTLIT